MSWRTLIVVLLIYSPTWAAAKECTELEGYIRNHRDNVTDKCDYECRWAQCGDVCINVLMSVLRVLLW